MDSSKKRSLSEISNVDHENQTAQVSKRSRRLEKITEYMVEEPSSIQEISSEDDTTPYSEDKSAFGTLMTRLETEAKANGIPEEFFVPWDKMDKSRDDKFFIVNKLPGKFLYLKEKRTLNVDDAKPEEMHSDPSVFETKDPDLVNYLQYPFPLVSFFVSSDNLALMPMEFFKVFRYSGDPDAVAKYTFSDVENGKKAFHPYYMLIDKFSLQLLRTGNYTAFFNPGKKKAADDKVLVGGYSIINIFFWIDGFPPEHPDHKEAQERREWAVIGAFQLLRDADLKVKELSKLRQQVYEEEGEKTIPMTDD